MPIISASHLTRYYRVYQKEPGFWGSIKALAHRKYYDVKAVDNISFEINEGELVGFIGPNGAGKTTTLKVLSGLLHPSSGKVSVLGYQPWERKTSFQKQFSLILGQRNQLWWDLPALDCFTLNKDIYEIPEEKYQKTLSDLVEMLGVEEQLKVAVRKLSLGQRMKMELIAALLHSPKVLLLDEPTIGLDVVAQKKMRDFIKQYNSQYQATIILTSHYMTDVEDLCQRIIIINKGVLIYDGLLSKVVERFAPNKIIEVDFSKKVELAKVEQLGRVTDFNGLHALIQVTRGKVLQQTGKLLDKFPVRDLAIGEPPIEDIIRQLFSEGGMSEKIPYSP